MTIGSSSDWTMSSVSTDTFSMREDPAPKVIFFSHDPPSEGFRDLYRQLHKRSKDAKFTLLNTFLADCVNGLRDEVALLPKHTQRLFPHFPSLLSLADRMEDLRHTPVEGAVETALLCALELAMLIGHYEHHQLRYDISKQGAMLAGLGVGLLAGAAVSVSTSLGELCSIGAECVRVAFRLGIRTDHISQTLAPRGLDGNRANWAWVVSGLELDVVQKEIDDYHVETTTTGPARLFLSAIDTTSSIVTGPPARLKDLFQKSQLLRSSKNSPLGVFAGICHAPHVFGLEDVAYVVESFQDTSIRPRPIELPLISSGDGRAFLAENAGSLIEAVCTEILIGTMRLEEIVRGILGAVAGKPAIKLFTFRTSIVTQGVVSRVEAALPNVQIDRLDLLEWSALEPGETKPRSSMQDKLAIVGMSCRLPGGADDTELFWELMMDRRDVHTTVPADRFDIATHVDPTGNTPNASHTPFGNFINNPGFFDAAFFHMSPKEALQTDPMHRLALVTAYEALEMAGYAPGRTMSSNLSRIGTFYGQASDDYREVNAGQDHGTYGVPGGERAFANGRINYFFKFGGPSFNIDTACSSGLAAVQAACSALWSNEADMVVAGGLSVITNPDNYCALSRGHFLSKTGQCKVWDESADGYCRADGIGSVVLKRLEDAERDNDNIIAVISSAMTNHSAQAASITQPHVGAQVENYKQVLHAAGVNPLDVTYVELHGTGTQVGDAVESESVTTVFAPLTPARPANQRLHLGAVKTNIGHGEAAAGISSLIKVLLTFQKNQIPPQAPMPTTMNSVVAKHLEKRNVGLVMDPTPWVRPAGKKRYALVNSFGAHGGNTTVLLEDAPEKIKKVADPRKSYPITVSARSKKSLQDNIQALIQYVETNPETDLANLSYTTCARRIHHNLRLAASVPTMDHLRKFLQQAAQLSSGIGPIPLDSPSVAFAFTGQGVFYNGIGSQMFRDFPFYRSTVQDLDRIVKQIGFPSITPTIKGTELVSDHPTVTQLAILVSEIALVLFLEHLGIRPKVVIGHSLGEYAALVAASVISAADAILLVGKRTELMLAQCAMKSHLMMTVRADVETIAKLAGNDGYEVSCINGLQETVISGLHEPIMQIQQKLAEKGVKAMPLEVPFAFHTSQLDPILEEFEKIASSIPFKAPAIPIISPTVSTCVFDGDTINASYLRRASREKVNFVGALDAASDLGIIDDKTIWVDIGPHPVCGTFIRKHLQKSKTVATLRKDEDNWSTITTALSMLHTEGVYVDWNEYFRPYESSLSLLHLPKYRWNEKDYWIPYVGTWTLDKAFHSKQLPPTVTTNVTTAFISTSSLHQVLSEEILESSGTLITLSDVMHPELFAAFYGHQMNGHGVATSSIWVDMGLTAANYLYRRLVPETTGYLPMNFRDMEVLHAQVIQPDKSVPQYIQMEAQINLESRVTKVYWFNVTNDGTRAVDHYASATITYEDSDLWAEEWERAAHLIIGRIDALTQSLDNPSDSAVATSKLSRDMTYTLYKNVVDYADHFRGMRSVVLSGFEAYSQVSLSDGSHGFWYLPPHWIDPACHVSGLIMNGSDAINTRDYFYVTHGWRELRFLEPLQANVQYRSYVKMVPIKDEAHMYAGDLYVLKGDKIIGMASRMRFKRIPRVLLKTFFSPGQGVATDNQTPQATGIVKKSPQPLVSHSNPKAASKPSTEKSKNVAFKEPPRESPVKAASTPPPPPEKSEAIPEGQSSIVTACIELMARETGLEMSELGDNATFADIGVDSLLSLVLSEKFRTELGLDVKSSVFLECQSLGELKQWLGDSY